MTGWRSNTKFDQIQLHKNGMVSKDKKSLMRRKQKGNTVTHDYLGGNLLLT